MCYNPFFTLYLCNISEYMTKGLKRGTKIGCNDTFLIELKHHLLYSYYKAIYKAWGDTASLIPETELVRQASAPFFINTQTASTIIKRERERCVLDETLCTKDEEKEMLMIMAMISCAVLNVHGNQDKKTAINKSMKEFVRLLEEKS
jgi:hypothetical protein